MKYLFGPVNSRRLGLSLGVDLMPGATCTLNCVYCECGGTTDLTDEIREYVPTSEVIAELDAFLSSGPRLDAVTFSGSGEPTLHSGLGAIIRHIRDCYPHYRVAVLTNGTLFWRPGVRRSVAGADIVVPSLDAVSPGAFERIGRPAPGITPEKVVEGLAAFRAEFTGRLIIEVFIVPGINDGEDEIRLIRDACLKIRPDLVQVNALDRPGAESWVRPAGSEELEKIAGLFAPLTAEVVGVPASGTGGDRRAADLSKSIILTLRRRPSTVDDLAIALGVAADEVMNALDAMTVDGTVVSERLARGVFYRLA